MSNTLTLETIRKAQANELAAVTEVIEATESRIVLLADKAAGRLAAAGDRRADYKDEFTQVGRIAVWDALSRYEGDNVDGFFAYMFRTVELALVDAVREQRNPGAGADPDALKVFASVLELAEGDAHLAEKLAQTVPPKGRRLSADRANAARLAWQGTYSIDLPSPGSEGSDEGDAMGAGNGKLSIGELFASDYGVPDDLVTADDKTKEQRRVKHAIVNGVLASMGEGQRDVIRHSFGIGNALCFGHGDAGDDEGLAAQLNTTVLKVRDARSKGLKAFAKRYVKVTAKTAAQADELTAAAAANLSRGGRK